MFSVSINEKKKKRQLKVPKKPMAVLLPTPHQEKEHQQKNRENKRNQERAGSRWGQFPLCSMLFRSETKRLLFARKGVGENGKTEKGK